MELTLYNQLSDETKSITITELSELRHYFDNNIYVAKYNDHEIDLDYSFANYNIKNYDIIVVTRKTNSCEKNKEIENEIIDSDMEYNEIYIKAQYENKKFKILIDCTSAHNIISLNVVKKLNLENKICVDFDNINGDTYGKLHDMFKIGSAEVYVYIEFKVYDIEDEIITVGLDLLNSYEMQLDFKNLILYFDNDSVKFLSSENIKKYTSVSDVGQIEHQLHEYYSKIIKKMDKPEIIRIKYAINILLTHCAQQIIRTETCESNGKIEISYNAPEYFDQYKILNENYKCLKYLGKIGFLIAKISITNQPCYYIKFIGTLDIIHSFSQLVIA